MMIPAHERFDCTSVNHAPPGVCFAGLAAIVPILSIASTVLSAVGQISAGNQANQSAKFEAAQYQEQAQEANAAASRKAANDIRVAGLTQSRARAVAAASGGSATDPTAVNIESNISGQGEYNALTDLWSGSAEAAGLQTRASGALAGGQNAQTAGTIGAVSTVLSGAGSMFAKYGEPSPYSQAGSFDPTTGMGGYG